MTKTRFPREAIAEQISEMRQMRGAMSDLISTACGLVARGTEVPNHIRLELTAALSHAEKADQLAQDSIRELYELPTPKGANDDREEAAA